MIFNLKCIVEITFHVNVTEVLQNLECNLRNLDPLSSYMNLEFAAQHFRSDFAYQRNIISLHIMLVDLRLKF